jgi:hypothetical protein
VTPSTYLYAVLAILFLAILVEVIRVRHRRGALRRLARQWDMHFSQSDRLRLADRICHLVPTPGAANVSVQDVIFRTEGNRHQYIFTLEYTVGVIRGKVGRFRVAGFDEPISRGVQDRPSPPRLILAPRHLSTAEAYSNVRDMLAQ